MYKIGMVSTACALAVQVAYGQSAADALRNIEQTKPTATQPKPAPRKPAVAATTDQGFARLKEIKVNSPLLQADLLTYWTSEINQPVSAQKLAEFKAFAWDLFQNKGYLAYITTSAQPTPEGSVLTVNVSFPTIGKVSVVTVDGNKGQEFAGEVARRFTEVYKTGAPVDVQGFENQLNAIAYDLPVDLEVSMRQVNDKVVDLVVNLRTVDAQPGKVLGGVVQYNNYGLKQFGRDQVLANVRLAGFTPLSELSLTTQQSSGVAYYRADYEAPIEGSGTRMKVYGSQVDSKATNVTGLSKEVGAGLTKLLSADRTTRWYAGTEVSHGTTRNVTSDIVSANRTDNQIRLRVRSESSKGWFDSYNNEFLLTAGRIDLNATELDTDPLHNAGNYQKIEMRGGLTQALDTSNRYTGAVRWRSQLASKNLDTGNQISLGGVNGIRTFTTLDGVGDAGVQLSFDLTEQFNQNFYGGLFYDVGMVKPHHTGLSGQNNNAYSLQGAGYQLGGSVEKVNWYMSVGKSFGKTPANWLSNNTRIGDWRLNFAATYAF